MARRGRAKVKLEEVETSVPPVPDQPQALPDAPGPGKTTEREARKRLKKAEADLKRIEKKQQKMEKAAERRERSVDKQLARIDRARRRPITAMAVLLLGLHGFASAMAILHLLFPDIELYTPLFYAPSPHWELIAICYVAAMLGSLAIAGMSPSVDFQQRARASLMVYLAVVTVATLIGLLLAFILEPMEGFDLDWMLAIWALVMVVAIAGVPMPILFVASRWGRSRAFLKGWYHWAMGILSVVLAVVLIILPFVFLAWQGWMVEVGLAIMMLGGLGLLFVLPPILWTMFAEAQLEGKLSLGAFAADVRHFFYGR